jgi:hypothetical protein
MSKTAASRMTKKQMKEELLKRGYDPNLLQHYKRDQLLNLLKEPDNQPNQTQDVDSDLAQMVEAFETTEQKPETDNCVDLSSDTDQEEIPTLNDPGWTQYVIGQFEEDEMDNKNPRVEGLRRLAEKLIGEIIEEGCDLITSPNSDNDFRACAKAWVRFNDHGTIKQYEALADAYRGNCGPEYAVYLCAMADTRAKGRCYRNALRLKKVVAAEEIDPSAVPISDEYENNSPIDGNQLVAIKVVAERHQIDLAKLFTYMEIKKQLSNLTKKEAKSILQTMHNMSTKDEIPNEIKVEGKND